MRKQYVVGIMLVILIITIIAVIIISGGYFEKNKFIGTWTTSGGGGTMTFTNDNKVTVTGQLGDISLSGTYTWAVASEKITFTSESGGSAGVTLSYRFPTSDQLIFTNSNGGSITLNKA
jgi:hypothetical protein